MIETKSARSDAANIETGMNTATAGTFGGVQNHYIKSLDGLQGRLALRPKEAAALGIGNNAIYELCNQQDFPTLKIGNKIIIPVDGLRRWLVSQTEGWPDV